MSNESNPSILLALSDVPTIAVISYHLERYGFIVNSCTNTDNLSETIEKIEPNILILDEDLVGEFASKDLCASLKNKNNTKDIDIILSSSNAKAAQLNNEFVNDVISKPFVPSTLVNKIKNFASNNFTKTQKILSYNDIEMNVSAFRVSRQGQEIHLGPTEFKILQCLLELPGKVLSREHIMHYVWGYNNNVEQRTIDVHINRLRNALKKSGDSFPLIKTIRASGYSLDAPRTFVKA